MFGLQMGNEMESFQQEMEKIFRGCGFTPVREPNSSAKRLKLRDAGEAFVVEAQLPGINAETLDINVLGRRLTLAGEFAEADAGEAVTWHRQERSRGAFRQALQLPLDVDSDKVEAEYKHGILRINLPKAASALPKQISVKIA